MSGKAVEGDPLRVLTSEIEEQDATLAVVGSHGIRRVTGIALGAVSTHLLHYAPCSVLIARGEIDHERWPRHRRRARRLGGVGPRVRRRAGLAGRYDVPLRAITATQDAHRPRGGKEDRAGPRGARRGRSTCSTSPPRRRTSWSSAAAACAAYARSAASASASRTRRGRRCWWSGPPAKPPDGGGRGADGAARRQGPALSPRSRLWRERRHHHDVRRRLGGRRRVALEHRDRRAGFANLVADGFSMGASNYLARRSDVENAERAEQADAARHGAATIAGFLTAGLVPLSPTCSARRLLPLPGRDRAHLRAPSSSARLARSRHAPASCAAAPRCWSSARSRRPSPMRSARSPRR